MSYDPAELRIGVLETFVERTDHEQVWLAAGWYAMHVEKPAIPRPEERACKVCGKRFSPAQERSWHCSQPCERVTENAKRRAAYQRRSEGRSRDSRGLFAATQVNA